MVSRRKFGRHPDANRRGSESYLDAARLAVLAASTRLTVRPSRYLRMGHIVLVAAFLFGVGRRRCIGLIE